MPKSRKIVGLLTILLLFLTSVVYAEQPKKSSNTESVSFIHWSDIHLGEEHTPTEVWNRAFGAGRNDPRASFYILSGDLVDNKKLDNLQFNKRVAAFSSDYLRPLVKEGKPVLIAYGNNDFYINYNTDPENMRPTMDLWRQAMGDAYYLDDLGNGIYPERLGGLTWITVNSLIFSPINSCPPSILKEQRQRTLEWLEAALAAVPYNSTAVIICHVPPCADAYNHKVMWDEESLRTFHSFLAETDCHVIVTSGHTHRNELHVIPISDIEGVPLVIVGSIAQKYGYLANYRLNTWEFNAKSGLPERLSWDLLYVDPNQGSRSEVISNPCDLKTWFNFRKQLVEDEDIYAAYIRDFYACVSNWTELSSDKKLQRRILDEIIVKSGFKLDEQCGNCENTDKTEELSAEDEAA
ncbi:MAG: metallophosphoesterase family protein [Candidatus Bruticola sp.]